MSVHSVALLVLSCVSVFLSYLRSSSLMFLIHTPPTLECTKPLWLDCCRSHPNMWLSAGTQIRSKNKITDNLNTVMCYTVNILGPLSPLNKRRQRTSDVSLSPFFCLPVSKSLFHEASHRTWKYHSL